MSERISDERLDALLRGEVNGDERERRLAETLNEFRAGAPNAPAALRDRVLENAALPAPEPSSPFARVVAGLSLRRAVLVLAPAALAVAVGAAAVQGIVTATSPIERQTRAGAPDADRGLVVGSHAEPEDLNTQEPLAPAQLRSLAPAQRGASPSASPTPPATDSAAGGDPLAPLPPSRARLQDYRVSMQVRVDDLEALSSSTQSVIRATRSFGGYIVSVDYTTPEDGQGDAILALRVPVGRVQAAIARFSSLGTIVAQQISISDLQQQADRFTREIAARRERIAKLRDELRDPTLTPAQRDRLEAQIAQARRGIARATGERRALVRQAQFAKISLTLTTRGPEAAKPVPGRIERALDDSWSVLARELAVLLYLLIVLSPVILLAAIALTAARWHSQRAETRLLERA